MGIIKVKLKPVGGDFINLFTTEKPIYSDDFIASINIQGFQGEGMVQPHNHYNDDHIETIRLTEGCYYPGLNDPNILVVGNTRVVPYMTQHGSDHDMGVGQWLSKKVMNSQVKRALHSIIGDNDLSLQVYELQRGSLVQIGISDDLEKLESIIHKPDIVLGLPEVRKFQEGDIYEALRTKGYKTQSQDFGRYVATLRD